MVDIYQYALGSCLSIADLHKNREVYTRRIRCIYSLSPEGPGMTDEATDKAKAFLVESSLSSL